MTTSGRIDGIWAAEHLFRFESPVALGPDHRPDMVEEADGDRRYPVRFGVLGPVALWPGRPGAEVLLSNREAILLAALLLRPAQPVWSEQLIEAIWEDDLPRDPMAALHNVVYRLRKVLTSAGIDDDIVVLGSGYALLTPLTSVDSYVFESDVTASHDLDPSLAQQQLQSALGMWRGNVFKGLSTSWRGFEAEVRRLEAMWFVALERRIECDLALGRHRDVVGELLSLTTRWPSRENLWALLMVAFHRSGMRAEALRAYRRLRDHLVSQSGIEPSRSLQELESEIAADRDGAGTAALALQVRGHA